MAASRMNLSHHVDIGHGGQEEGAEGHTCKNMKTGMCVQYCSSLVAHLATVALNSGSNPCILSNTVNKVIQKIEQRLGTWELFYLSYLKRPCHKIVNRLVKM